MNKEKVKSGDEIKLEHLDYVELLSDEEMEEKELPKSILKQIQMLKANISRYNNKPSDNFYDSIHKMDLAVASVINDYIEASLPTKEEYEAQQQAKKNPPVTPVTPVSVTPPAKTQEELDAEKKAQEEKEKEDARILAESATNELVNKVKEKLDANKQISVTELSTILGKNVEGQSNLSVGNLKLRRPYLQKHFVQA